MIAERAAAAREAARIRGRQVGPPSALTGEQVAMTVRMRAAGESVGDIGRTFGVGRSTLYRLWSSSGELPEAATVRPDRRPPMNGRRPFRLLLGIAAALLLAGCQLPGDNLPPPPVNPTTGLTGAPADGAGSPGAGSPVGGGLLHAGGGWTAAGIVGVFPPAGSCHLRFTPVGEPLPDPRCTPTLAAVQQAMTSNWTTAVKTLGLPMIPAGYTG